MAPVPRCVLQPSLISLCPHSLPSPAKETTANLTPNPMALARSRSFPLVSVVSFSSIRFCQITHLQLSDRLTGLRFNAPPMSVLTDPLPSAAECWLHRTVWRVAPSSSKEWYGANLTCSQVRGECSQNVHVSRSLQEATYMYAVPQMHTQSARGCLLCTTSTNHSKALPLSTSQAPRICDVARGRPRPASVAKQEW
jgi:hypothetical protein